MNELVKTTIENLKALSNNDEDEFRELVSIFIIKIIDSLEIEREDLHFLKQYFRWIGSAIERSKKDRRKEDFIVLNSLGELILYIAKGFNPKMLDTILRGMNNPYPTKDKFII